MLDIYRDEGLESNPELRYPATVEPSPLENATEPDAWIQMIGAREATGDLLAAYEELRGRSGTRPSVYHPPSGEVPHIVRVHSLAPEGLRLAFAVSAVVHWGPTALPWREREVLNTVTSAANGCRY